MNWFKKFRNVIKGFCATRKFWTIIAALFAAAISFPFALLWFWLPIVPFLALMGVFVYNALKKIPAQPPSKGVLTFFGKRLEVVLDEGWRYFPFYPFVFGFILVKVEKVNYDLPPQEVRTPDRALISVLPSVTWVAGIKDSPRSYIVYLNSGGEEGVKKIIHDVIEDRTKTWATSNKEGPSSWMEALAMKDDAHEVLAKSLLGWPKIDSPIPTNTWMRFLDTPQSEPTRYDTALRPGEQSWASKDEATGKWNWDGLQAIFSSYSIGERAKLRTAIDERRDDVRKLREGKGDGFADESLGITILRFTINDVRVLGAVAEAADKEEKERRERDADTMEINNVSARVQGLRKDHPGMSLDEAIRLVQTERGKISKSVIEVLGAQTGLGQDLLGALGFQKMPDAGNPGGNPGPSSNPSDQGGKNPGNPGGLPPSPPPRRNP